MLWRTVLLFVMCVQCVVIPTVQLSNGVQLPLVAMGTGTSCKYNSTDAELRVKMALSAGFNHIDTAFLYQNLPGVAAGIKGVNRSSLFITSKVPGCGSALLLPPCYNNTVNETNQVLELLQTEYVDLMLLHQPPAMGCNASAGCLQAQEQWRALEDIYLTTHKIRAIGVSNYCQNCLECVAKAARVMPMANQVAYHVGMGGDPQSLISYCEAHKIVIEAYSPLAEGAVLQNFTVGDKIAQRLNVSSAQVALGWLAQRQHVVVTTSTNNTAHLVEDRQLWDFSLTSQDFGDLDALPVPADRICNNLAM
jgi:diketogulonate reductase-like aldo/keto reductase